MKSSRPVSAHWRSSNTSTVVPRSAIRSKKSRQAGNSTSRPPAGASSTPSRRQEAGPMRSRSLASGHVLVERRRDASRVVASSSSSVRPRAAPHHLAERPERDPLAVRRRAAAMPVDVLRDAVDVLLQLPDQPALADAARSGDRDQAHPPVAADRVERRPSAARSSSSRPTNGGSRASARPWPPRWRRPAAPATPAPGAVLPLSEWSPSGSKTIAARRARRGRLADEDRAGLRDALQARGGVDEVAGHHALVRARRG